MEEADTLFVQLKQQDQCIEEFLALAEELENHVSSNTGQMFGNYDTVCGFGALTKLFGSLAFQQPAPLAATKAAPQSLKAAAFSTIPGMKESDQLMKTINKTKTLMKEVEEIGDTIQTLLNKLSAKCTNQALGASAASSGDESDECEVTTQIMGALARRSGIDVPLDLLRRFNKTTVFNKQVRPDVAPTWKTGAAAVLTLNVDLKSAIKRTLLVAGEALSACDKVKNNEEIKNNWTGASRSLRSAARKMEEERRNLREITDTPLEIIRKLSEFRTLLKNLGEYSFAKPEDPRTEAEQKLLDYIKAICPDDTIISWVERNQTLCLNAFRFLRDNLLKPLEEEIKRRKRSHVHIVFVAHGSITDEFMPASVLVPTSSITDTILYSPWNCRLHAYAAYGIAEGCIEPHLREFYNIHWDLTSDKIFLCTIENHVRVPDGWNHMRQSMLKQVPHILLRPVTPNDPAWQAFVALGGYVYRDDRIIIPYLQPDDNAPPIPFFMLIFATAYILEFTGVTATVHLAACLGREENKQMWVDCEKQYAYTVVKTIMSMNIKGLNVNRQLLDVFGMMFDNDDQQ